MNTDKKEIWPMAQSWVHSHKVLIWCIAAPYYRHMSCDSYDLAGEALTVAYQVFSTLIQRNQDVSLITRYFRVVYRSRCIQMAAGVFIAASTSEIPTEVVAMEKQQKAAIDESAISEALFVLTDRQRQISQWILEQQQPVSIATIARHFGIQGRTIREILSNSIKRIENSSKPEKARYSRASMKIRDKR